MTNPDPDLELIDAGDGRRLERFGDHLVDRPHPAAVFPPRDPGAWVRPDLRYDRDDGWTGADHSMEPWTVSVAGVRLLLRPASGGQLGCFPEHVAAARRVANLAAARSPAGEPMRLLNLFAYTGLVSLAGARAGALVTHVDASRTAVAWARSNAAASGLTGAAIRWIVDDAPAFAAREARRGQRYDAIVMDPPTYGHGQGRTWRIDRDLDALLRTCAGLLEPDGLLHVSSHSPGLWDDDLARAVAAALEVAPHQVEAEVLRLRARSGLELILGTSAVVSV